MPQDNAPKHRDDKRPQEPPDPPRPNSAIPNHTRTPSPRKTPHHYEVPAPRNLIERARAVLPFPL
jgi:hypothetical protein